jgi:hypothetical protein
VTTTTTPATPDPASLDALFAAIAKADAGDAAALDALRAVFRDAPGIAERVSSLAHNAETAVLASVPPGAAAVFREQAATLRKDLREEGTGTALEAMLIRRIALDFMASLQADRSRFLVPGETRPLELARFYDQQADRAHRRFLASVEALARVRKLIVPIQINIAQDGGQQVNVAGTVATRS